MGGLHGFEQAEMGIGPMNHGVGVTKAFGERLASRNIADLLTINRIVHHHKIGMHGPGSCRLTDAERVKGRKAVGPDLKARPDLTQLWRLLQNLDPKAVFDQGQSYR
jgi:hypothetical protein